MRSAESKIFCTRISKKIGRAPMSGRRRSGWNRNRWLEAGILRRTAGSAYRCCLPALAGFTPRRRTRPASSMLRISPDPQRRAATREFSSAKAGCRKREPLSPRLARPKRRLEVRGWRPGIVAAPSLQPQVSNQWRTGWDSNPRGFDTHTLSRRAP